MNEIKSSNAESKQPAHSDFEQAGTEETGGENQAVFSPGKSFSPKVTGGNSIPLNRENIMRLQPLIGNQAVMRLIAAKKQAVSPPVQTPVSSNTIQRKVQVDIDQFGGLSHFGNKLMNTTFIQLKNTYKAYLKTNDPTKETKLVAELLNLCDQWMIKHAALAKKKDPKKLDVITRLKLAIAEEAATQKQVLTDKTGKKVTFDPSLNVNIPPPSGLNGVPKSPPVTGGTMDFPSASTVPVAPPTSTLTGVPKTQAPMTTDLQTVDPQLTNSPPVTGGQQGAQNPRQELIDRVGLPPAYINGLSQPDFDLLVTADKALDDGDVVEADKSFSTLRTSLGGVVNMLKGFLMRYHMGNIHPELSKMMDDPTFVVPGDKAVKAQDQVSGLAKKFHDDKKTAGQPADKRYLDIAKTVGQMQNSSQDEFGTLTIQEATALVGYLSDLYPNYNNPLRMGIGQTAGPNAFGEENLNLTATAISALNKMTPYAGKVFRHSGVFPGYLEMHQAGAVIPDLAFMSSAKTQHGTQGGLNHDSLEVILDTRTGKDMEEAAWFGGESEILFKPGTRFRVLVRLDLTSMPGGKWPTEAEASTLGWGPNELELIKYLHADNEKAKIKHLILKKEA